MNLEGIFSSETSITISWHDLILQYTCIFCLQILPLWPHLYILPLLYVGLSVSDVPHTARQLLCLILSLLSEHRGSSQTKAASLTAAWVATAGFPRMPFSRYTTTLTVYSRAGEPFSGLVPKLSTNFEQILSRANGNFYEKDMVLVPSIIIINPLNAELNPICHLLALLGVHFLHVSRIRVKSLTLRLLMSYIWSTYSWCF